MNFTFSHSRNKKDNNSSSMIVNYPFYQEKVNKIRKTFLMKKTIKCVKKLKDKKKKNAGSYIHTAIKIEQLKNNILEKNKKCNEKEINNFFEIEKQKYFPKHRTCKILKKTVKDLLNNFIKNKEFYNSDNENEINSEENINIDKESINSIYKEESNDYIFNNLTNETTNDEVDKKYCDIYYDNKDTIVLKEKEINSNYIPNIFSNLNFPSVIKENLANSFNYFKPLNFWNNIKTKETNDKFIEEKSDENNLKKKKSTYKKIRIARILIISHYSFIKEFLQIALNRHFGNTIKDNSICILSVYLKKYFKNNLTSLNSYFFETDDESSYDNLKNNNNKSSFSNTELNENANSLSSTINSKNLKEQNNEKDLKFSSDNKINIMNTNSNLNEEKSNMNILKNNKFTKYEKNDKNYDIYNQKLLSSHEKQKTNSVKQENYSFNNQYAKIKETYSSKEKFPNFYNDKNKNITNNKNVNTDSIKNNKTDEFLVAIINQVSGWLEVFNDVAHLK